MWRQSDTVISLSLENQGFFSKRAKSGSVETDNFKRNKNSAKVIHNDP